VIHVAAVSRYFGFTVTTRSAFIRSSGITRTAPARGLGAFGPKTFSRSCTSDFTS